MESATRITEEKSNKMSETFHSASSESENVQKEPKNSEKDVFIPESTPKSSTSISLTLENQKSTSIKADSANYTPAEKLEIKQDYLRVFNRYSRKRKIYTATAQYFKKLEGVLITLPLILIQLFGAVLPLYHKNNELVSSVLAAVTAALITAQAKLHWSSTSDKFQTVAEMYSSLADQCYYQYLECSKNLEQFLTNANEIERASRRNCPPPPIWIEHQYRKERTQSSLEM